MAIILSSAALDDFFNQGSAGFMLNHTSITEGAGERCRFPALFWWILIFKGVGGLESLEVTEPL